MICFNSLNFYRYPLHAEKKYLQCFTFFKEEKSFFASTCKLLYKQNNNTLSLGAEKFEYSSTKGSRKKVNFSSGPAPNRGEGGKGRVH